ncbi:hypothetical protein T265_10898 [Opisthorchis viverrini]|uniref:Ion transport domain-containing protein n=1 Tax=Opisthorchis viverrini TaxID=6198 RepID=A0A074ZBH7_OPIVI|nr:hypothetical protein T265_10898 [Opisthorchis viverrini]KER20575.1 hypothetical protein T265_10898 [Opisthorchis viverrini]
MVRRSKIARWLEFESIDRKVRGSNPISVSRLPLSRLGQPSPRAFFWLHVTMGVLQRLGQLFAYHFSTSRRIECTAKSFGTQNSPRGRSDFGSHVYLLVQLTAAAAAVVYDASLVPDNSDNSHLISMPKHRLPIRVLFSVPPSEWRKPRSGQRLSWHKGVKEITRVCVLLVSYQSIGIFVIMFLQVSTTIMKSASVLSILFFAFAVTFHKLLTLPEEQEFDESPQFLKNRLAYCFLGFEHLNHSTTNRPDVDLSMKVYANMGLALFQTLMMMVGEYEHTEVITKPYLDTQASTIYIPELTFPFFALFVFLVPISLMNLMIGLAVGDIDKVRRSATQQLIAQQVYWLETLEARCPMWLYRRIYVPFWIRRPAATIKKRFRLNVYYQVRERWLKWLEREFTDRKVSGSNPTSAS